MNSSTRVRYGRVDVERPLKKKLSRLAEIAIDSIPKNTLLTIREGDLVHFGIARCNKVANDRFNKSTGKMIARNRAILAFDEHKDNNDDIKVHSNGLRGTVAVEKITWLLEYFRNIDANLNPNLSREAV